jgi:hypothetical protein
MGLRGPGGRRPPFHVARGPYPAHGGPRGREPCGHGKTGRVKPSCAVGVQHAAALPGPPDWRRGRGGGVRQGVRFAWQRVAGLRRPGTRPMMGVGPD